MLPFGPTWPVPHELGLRPAERRDVVFTARQRWLKSPRNMTIYAGGIALMSIAIIFLPNLVPQPAGMSQPTHLLLIATAIAVVCLVALAALWKIGFPPYVYAELRARGHDICPRCGYHRRGLDAADPCPECATVITPPSV